MMLVIKQKDYLDEFHAVSKQVSRIFDSYLITEIEKRGDSDLLKILYRKFLEPKKGKVHNRAMFVYIAAKFFDIPIDSDLKNILPLMVIPELSIWSNYALNWVTDEKNNVSGTKLEENIDIVASQYLLTEVLYFLPDRMLRKYLEWYRRCMRGYISVEVDLTITNFERLENERDFWTAYNRNHCIADVGELYAYCFEMVDEYFMLKTPNKQMSKIRKIMLEFGATLQVNGDISDFIVPNDLISTTEKRPRKDYFIDIRTDRLTYPIWLLFKKCKTENPELFKEIKKVAKEKISSDEFYWRVHAYLKESGIIKEVLGYIRKQKNRLLREIDKLGIKNEGLKLWKAALLILTDNKFARQIKRDYDIV